MSKSNYLHLISEKDVEMVTKWVTKQGGLQVWKSINLSNPDAEWLTPVTQSDGTPTKKPSWQSESTPSLVITNLADIGVRKLTEVKRFRVALRKAGMGLKLTDASSRKLNKTLSEAGEFATYEFQYDTQEVVVYKSEEVGSLLSYVMER